MTDDQLAAMLKEFRQIRGAVSTLVVLGAGAIGYFVATSTHLFR
jgi:hypothetical protein